MSALTYVDSTIIGLLFGFQGRLRKNGGGLSLCSIPEHLKETFKILRVGEFIEIHPDREAALAASKSE